MEKVIKILKCIDCASKARFYYDVEYNKVTYYLKCENCGKTTKGHYSHMENAVSDWNLLNTPAKAKPTYRCGNCESEIHLGFSVCPACGAEIEW